ncbi:MAG: ABC transporter ATP-binding protein/permease [Spirochaetaceae bacterium]|jgi:ATP-binding cassette subfamily B protein|nr:ABC transporter ATP-binding protein/permease [Spirochaetaceae bacterium]
MQDFIETEAVVKEYDSAILKRIAHYIKKYKAYFFLTMAALVVSTVGELLVPVLEQRLIDEAIMRTFLRIDVKSPNIATLDETAKNELSRITGRKNTLAMGQYLFVPETSQMGLSKKIKNQLEEKNILDSEQWYAYTTDAHVSAMTKKDLAKLPVAERKIIRSADIRKIFIVVGILLVVLIIVFAATFAQLVSASLVGQKVMRDIRMQLFTNTASLSTGFLSLNPVGRIVSRLSGDVETINEFFTSVVVAFLKDISIMIGVLFTLFYLSPSLALVVVVCLPPVLITTAISRVRARDAFRRQRLASSAITAYLSEHLSLLNIVQLFRREKKSMAEFGQRNNELLHANMDEMYVFAVFRPIVEFLAVLTTAAVIIFGAQAVLNLNISLGVLVAFINLVAMFYGPVMDISEKYTILQSAMAGGERVFNLLDTNEKIPNDAHSFERQIQGSIEFKNVHFSYKRGEAVLKNLSFTVEHGQRAAIVGYTGAGKTTITNILARLWDIDSGEITLDGINIKDIPLATLRRAVLPVLQDVFLFSGSIAENIRLGLPLSEAELKAAAHAVSADTFIEKLPEGYNTMLSEGAVNISAGEKQLISFARVIAHNPKVVILDEATSSIDTETERLVQEGMAKVLAGRTSIVIAHRLSTIRGADKILVLSNGALVEEGTHAELLDKGGLYTLLCKLQFE